MRGHRGFGIEFLRINAENISEIYEKLMGYPEGIIEESVAQHPKLNRLYAGAINTLRVVSINSKFRAVTPDGRKKDIVYATLRIGSGGGRVDNIHSGGMGARVDLKKGKLITDAVDLDCHIFKKHPDTGVKIRGFQVPYFKEAIQLVEDACDKKRVYGYLGWDIALTPDGPELIEVNTNPGTSVLAVTCVVSGIPSKPILEKYL